MTAAAVPERVPAIVTWGAWDPRPEEPPETSEYNEALRRGGTLALVERFQLEDGASFDREFPPWARAVTLRGDPEALLAAGALERWTDGIPDEELRSFPVSALLIAGEFDDEDDDATKVAAMIPTAKVSGCAASDMEGRASPVRSRSPPPARSSTAGSPSEPVEAFEEQV
jgi:hypothetical protein